MSPDHTPQSIERACADLARASRPITFTAIAAVTGISRSILYRNSGLRAIIDHHKNTPEGPLTAITDEVATLRAAVTTLADQVRSHEEQIRRLRK